MGAPLVNQPAGHLQTRLALRGYVARPWPPAPRVVPHNGRGPRSQGQARNGRNATRQQRAVR